MLRLLIAGALPFALLFAGCKTVPQEEAGAAEKAVEKTEEEVLLTCLFAGDVMAHNVNYRMADYSSIWAGIKDEVRACDLAFANIEMPVDDNVPMASYPEFNVHSPYAEAAIAAGFNVFSLVNNHTNDQGLEGMQATAKWAKKCAEESARGARPVYFSGLKESDASPMSYAVIEKDGWRVLFLAVTEILNRFAYRKNMNYIGADEESRASFLEEVKVLRKNNPCDIFVLAVHANVPEYVHTISQSRREWYGKLLEAGADVVWANHPHIVQDVAIEGEKVIMFACGNTISGQRSQPQFAKPETERDWTGDGLMMKVVFKKDGFAGGGCKIKSSVPLFITTYVDGKDYVIKMLDEKTCQKLEGEGKSTWAKYLRERRKILEKVSIDCRGELAGSAHER